MRFDEHLLDTVGFLIGERRGQSRGPIGTFFIIQEETDGWDDKPDRGMVRWMITARHVVDDPPARDGVIEARMRQGRGGDPIDFPAQDWIFPDDDQLDVAI